MKTKHVFLGLMMFIATTMAMTSCKKSDSAQIPAGKQNLSLYLTDGPGFFDQVFVDIKSIQVLVDTTKDTRKNDTCNWDRLGAYIGSTFGNRKDSGLVWTNLNINAGVYDILNLRNGVDTLLASTEIPKGAIRLIRIEIGSNNSVVKDSVTYPLYWPDNLPKYILIKLKGHESEEYMPNKLRLWLDFDVNRSIIVLNNNKFYLKPVFHFFIEKTTASVSGKVKPMDAKAVLTLFNGTDTAYALPNRNGEFKMRGLKNGTYSLYINASNNYKDTTINNIVVQAPKNTSVGVIELKK
nr:DUF4382 domain-containing protein [uncultured Sediminibacterium sp.]